ncbi:hypothetical protein BDZ94DRAFT_900704 [Collybia nuda]|uniref:Domain of unknown function at the cortex 1 domain-containing protein n=1 Tax=Collybia nuda TaxID=64659 RepID=A0A9P5YF47_9AGAR|nr:hypothetical protein BDZ94DRAFT_900704 [Collybia nuda]
MAPRFRVLAGATPETMTPITSKVNTNEAHRIVSELFEGEVVVNIKGFTDSEGQVKDSDYFSREDRQGITWSLQVRGRFLKSYSADDILFGNTFDRPLKLPWGSGAALKFMNYMDPTLTHDLSSSTKPWALSPLVSTMPHLAHARIPSGSPHERDFLKPDSDFSGPKIHDVLPPFPPSQSLVDDTSQIHLALSDMGSPRGSSSSASSSTSSVSSTLSVAHSFTSAVSSSSKKSKGSSGRASKIKDAVNGLHTGRKRKKVSRPGLDLETASQRRSYFSSAEHRQAIHFGPKDVITTDFCYGFLEFSPTLSLRLPGGISFDLMRYWDRQPVRFVCCERKETAVEGEDPWGALFWCVAIEVGDEEEGPEVEQ